jgi:hypothetical protein
MYPDIKDINGACHCKKVKFHVRLTSGLTTARRCNCSYCRMRGAVAVSADLDGLTILEGEEHLTLYQFNSRLAKHFFCSNCGIYTFHQRRSNPHQYGINVACLEGMSPFDFEEVVVLNGVQHPADGTSPHNIAGILKFSPPSP